MKSNLISVSIIGAIIILILVAIIVGFKIYNVNEIKQTSIMKTTEVSESLGDNESIEDVRGEFAVEEGEINIVYNSVINTIENKDVIISNTNSTSSYIVNSDKGSSKVTSTEPHIPDGMEVADPNDNSGIKASDIKFNRSPENVTIEVLKDTITNTSAEILITDNNEDKYGWGVQFKIQEKVNDEWKDLEYISDEVAWISIAYNLNEDNQLKQKLNFENYYGKLESGIYRVVKSQWDNNEYIDLYSDEFEIK